MVKESACRADVGSIPGSGKIPCRRVQQPTPVFLLGEFHCIEEPGRLQSIQSQIWTPLKRLSTHAYVL